jgi:hypothetical protein
MHHGQIDNIEREQKRENIVKQTTTVLLASCRTSHIGVNDITDVSQSRIELLARFTHPDTSSDSRCQELLPSGVSYWKLLLSSRSNYQAIDMSSC